MQQPIQPLRADKFTVVHTPNASPEQLFCDGVAGISMGSANTKLDLYQIIGNDPTKGELRKVVLTAVIPTGQLVEFCNHLLSAVRGNSKVLQGALTEQSRKIFGSSATATTSVGVDSSPKA